MYIFFSSFKILFKAVSPFCLSFQKPAFQRALKEEGKTFTECSKKISPSHITQSLARCEHKGQGNGLIPYIIVKGLVRLMHREAIYHPDLSIFKTFTYPPFPPLHTYFLNALLRREHRNHLKIFFFFHLNMT